ncbi:MAG TPA: molybdopterin-dependent oxidoreductase, partial [Nocardioides sp.]|nr:molybdopterin-dependent oxidoreductase [Nocardioides sp.]
GTRVFGIAPFSSRGLQKMNGTLLRTAPGAETAALEGLANDGDVALDSGGVILVGERLATVPGALSAAASLARTTGARLAWVPRRAGDRGALDAGCLPGLLPGGRPVSDASARADLGAVWGAARLPDAAGRDADGIVAALAAGELGGLVVAGVDPDDTADPAATRAAVEAAGFVVSLELRATDLTRAADVVLPVAPAVEKSGTFVTWEGRPRPFEKVLPESHALPDLRVLAGIAEELGVDLGFRTVEQARAELAEIGPWDGARADLPSVPAAEARVLADGELRLATWRQMIDDGSLLDGDAYLKATGRAAVALVSPSTLAGLGLVPGEDVTLTGDRGSVALPVATADLPDDVVWLPGNTGGVNVNRDLAAPGSPVRVTGGAA